jgi:Ca2+-binding EF-hand superfamily protein
MGGGPSSSAEGKAILNSAEVKHLVADLGLRAADARYFFNLFSDLDADKGGSISLDEFYQFFGIVDRTAFADRAFSVLDEDQSGELDYHEFLAGIWSLCSSSDGDLCNFLFSLFDEDGSHTLDDAEVESALRMLHNQDPLPDQVRVAFDDLVRCQRLNQKEKKKKSDSKKKKMKRKKEKTRGNGDNSDGNMLQLQDIDSDDDTDNENDDDATSDNPRGSIRSGDVDVDALRAITTTAADLDEVEVTLEDFIMFNGKHPILLEPAVALRDMLRRQIRGRKYWARLEKARAAAFGPTADLDEILFSKKRSKAAAEAEEREAQAKRRKDNIKKLKKIRKQRKEEAYQARVKDKWENAMPEETEHREAHKALERAREILEEAEEEGASKEECVRLRRRLQQAQIDMEEARDALYATWEKQMANEMAKCDKFVEQRVRKKLLTRKAKKRIAKDAKMMRWVFNLLPQVDKVFEGFNKISLKDCREKVIEEHILAAVKEERKNVKKKYKRIRKDEERFVRDEVLTDPWAEGPWDEEETDSEESEQESVFLGDEDWELHVSVDGCHFVSVDIRQWHEITGVVPPRILHAAGIHVQKQRRVGPMLPSLSASGEGGLL